MLISFSIHFSDCLVWLLYILTPQSSARRGSLPKWAKANKLDGAGEGATSRTEIWLSDRRVWEDGFYFQPAVYRSETGGHVGSSTSSDQKHA